MDVSEFEKDLKDRGLLARVEQERRQHGLTLEDLLTSRYEPALSARLALYRFLLDKKFTYVMIGKIFQRRHTSIVMAIQRAGDSG